MVLTIREVMDRDFLVADRATTVAAAARQMAEARHGFVLLVDDGRPTGIVTEWDVIEKVLAAGRDPAATPLSAIASAPVVSCDETTPTGEVVETMVQRGVRRMVVTGGGKTVGVVGSKDVLRIFHAYVDKISADIARLQSSFP